MNICLHALRRRPAGEGLSAHGILLSWTQAYWRQQELGLVCLGLACNIALNRARCGDETEAASHHG